MKKAILGLIFIILINIASGAVGNITQFDDGCDSCNITASSTKYITLITNASIQQANITIKGILTNTSSYYDDNDINSFTVSGGNNELHVVLCDEFNVSYYYTMDVDSNVWSLVENISQDCINGHTYVDSDFYNNIFYFIYRNNTGYKIYNYSSGTLNYEFLLPATSSYISITIDNNEDKHIFVGHRHFYFNSTGTMLNESLSYSGAKGMDADFNLYEEQFYVALLEPRYALGDFVRVANGTTGSWEYTELEAQTNKHADMAGIESSSTDGAVLLTYSNQHFCCDLYSKEVWKYNGTDWGLSSLGADAYKPFYRMIPLVVNKDEIYVATEKYSATHIRQWNGSTWTTPLTDSMRPAILMKSVVVGTDVFHASRDRNDKTHIKILTKNKYPSDVLIKVNNTIVFNHTGNLTGTNISINLNTGDVLEDCFIDNAQCSVDFSASTWGKLEISDLFVEYNKTNSAILTITDPSEITASVNSGEDYTVAVNISNTGEWNATNISFETVSAGGSPNYNSSITHNCGDSTLANGSSIICNVTFNDLTQNPEPDEKLKVKSIGSDFNDVVYSNSIDVDITVTASPSGGGGGSVPGRCNWKIKDPANKVWNALGHPLGEYARTRIIIDNNETAAIVFNFKTESIEGCKFEHDSLKIEGSSRGVNYAMCPYPDIGDKMSGKIIIEGGDCDSSIKVDIVSNGLGLFLLVIFAGINVYISIIFWMVVLGIIYFSLK